MADYEDSKGVPTVGHGFNLDDEENQGIMKMHGIDPAEVKAGKRGLASEETEAIRDSILARKEQLVRGKMGSDFFDLLPPNKKAALMSMGYQSLNNLGPNLRNRMAQGDEIGAIREMILNTNADADPGILKRRLKEAELYGGPLDFSGTFKTLSSEEKQKIVEIINKTQNEHTKKELIEKYGPYLGLKQEPLKLFKLANMVKR
jgi:GH24 family phage-related lysozyme (muramidase)